MIHLYSINYQMLSESNKIEMDDIHDDVVIINDVFGLFALFVIIMFLMLLPLIYVGELYSPYVPINNMTNITLTSISEMKTVATNMFLICIFLKLMTIGMCIFPQCSNRLPKYRKKIIYECLILWILTILIVDSAPAGGLLQYQSFNAEYMFMCIVPLLTVSTIMGTYVTYMLLSL